MMVEHLSGRILFIKKNGLSKCDRVYRISVMVTLNIVVMYYIPSGLKWWHKNYFLNANFTWSYLKYSYWKYIKNKVTVSIIIKLISWYYTYVCFCYNKIITKHNSWFWQQLCSLNIKIKMTLLTDGLWSVQRINIILDKY